VNDELENYGRMRPWPIPWQIYQTGSPTIELVDEVDIMTRFRNICLLNQGFSDFAANVPPYVIYHIQYTTNNYFTCLNEKQYNKLLYATEFIEGNYLYFVSFHFFLSMPVYP
jgi:hypothetical protein